LYEELLVGGNDQEKTEHELIFVDKSHVIPRDKMQEILDDLRAAAESGNRDKIFASLHRAVPDFKDPDDVNTAFLAEDMNDESSGVVETASF
ncbi:MAG: hypothetical protein RSC43_07090, partial [Clostridia bacterium]